MEKLDACIPFDPVTRQFYINAVGSNSVEATVNLDLLDLDEDVLNRMEVLDCRIHVLNGDEEDQ